MKADNVADLLYKAGWRPDCDAQTTNITAIVVSDELLDAIFRDRQVITCIEAQKRAADGLTG